MSTFLCDSLRAAVALGVGTVALLATGDAHGQGLAPGSVYTSTNDAVFNRVAVYDRAADGVITFRTSIVEAETP